MKQENWVKTLLSFAAPCKGKMILSVICATISVIGGFIPYLCVYHIIQLFIAEQAAWKGVCYWVGMGVLGYVMQVIFYGISTTLSHISAYTILEGLRKKVADKLMHAPLGVVSSKSIGNLKNIIVDRIDAVEPPLAHMIPELSSNLLLPIIVFIALCSIDYRMGLSVLVTVPFAAVPMITAMKTFNKQYDAYMKANDHVNSIIVEYVEGIEVVKAFNQASHSYEKFTKAIESFKNFTMDWFKSTWAPMNLTLCILPSTLVGTLPVGIALYLGGILNPEQVAFCLMLAMGIVAPLMKTVVFINEGKSMEYAVKDANEILHMEELPEAEKNANLKDTTIKLNNVSFAYSGKKEEAVLKDINLTIGQGSFTALVGPSGGGKSTIARLISRFWDVTDGKLTIGGKDIKEIPLKELSGLISFVTQDNFLFDCSLKENIRLGNPKASDAEVMKAAEMAQCGDFLGRLDKGLETSAGDAGKQLSGGERQRIAIARMILKDAPIVILDEATAFTDPENEEKIQKSLMALTKGKSLLVIAHRLSTIQKADQIVVLKAGQIADKGTHEELLKESSLYQKLWWAHIGAKNWSAAGIHEEDEEMEERAYV